MLRSLKFAGLTIGFVGIAVGLLNLFGYFAYEERVDLRDRIRDVPGAIARIVPGFDGFVERFPPPDGVEQATITHIVKDVLQTHDQFPIAITLRYLAGGERRLQFSPTLSDGPRKLVSDGSAGLWLPLVG